MQLDLFDKVPDPARLKVELFEAYYECRSNKRNTLSALEFELDFESRLMDLAEDMIRGCYSPDPCYAFVVRRPVQREVFAASFRDRVVHHWLITKINPLFEDYFIEDSYACRIGKGTHYGVSRMAEFMKEGLESHRNRWWVLKLDIRGFFMHINRNLLMQRLIRFLLANYKGDDLALVLETASILVHSRPDLQCIIRGLSSDWDGLPPDKSLFHSPGHCGLPIGNLTSQVFANFYLHSLDCFVSQHLGFIYYGRYVDDFVMMDSNPSRLKAAIPSIAAFLRSDLGLTLHPRKVYMQPAANGFQFLGAVIKPGRIYAASRIKGNFYAAITEKNRVIDQQSGAVNPIQKAQCLCTINSYLGLMIHYNTWRLRRRMLCEVLDAQWLQYFKIRKDYGSLLPVAKARRRKSSKRRRS
jgi:hypothetical protein